MKIILALGLLWLSPLAASAAEEGFPFFEPITPPRAYQLMVHRGMAMQAPENTRRAIEMCIEDGYEWVEVDVRLTKDGQHVLFHDSELDGKTNGKGPIKGQTLEELKRLDAGSWFAKRYTGQRLLSLEEAFVLAKNRINLYLDCKETDPNLLGEQIKANHMESQVLVFDRPEQLRRVRAGSEGTVAVMPKWHPKDGMGAWIDELRPAAVEIDADETTPDVCREFHARGIKVQAKVLGEWDNPKFWDKVLSDGVDYLQTDLPDEIVAHVLDQKLKPRPVRITCHRGASRYAPENTLPAFEKAYRLKADFVEFDVRPSRTGKSYLLHDAQLNRTTNGKGLIKEASNETIDGLDAGSWFGRPFDGAHVPSLNQFLAAVPKDVSLYFDAKDIPPAALAAAINKYNLAERTIVYQSAGYLEKLKEIEPRIRALPGVGSAGEVTALATRLKPYGVDTRWNVLSKEYIEQCHAANIQVFADAPPFIDVGSYRRAIEWGIDVIQTDHPIRLWRAMEQVAAARAQQ
jgi:glycerophosphoryl diester phosphodiesterase